MNARNRLLAGLAVLSMAAACQPGPAARAPAPPSGDSQEERPTGQLRPTYRPTPAPGSDEHLPSLVRPAWNGTRKPPVAAKVLAFPATWKGQLSVRDLAMVGSTLYTVDRTLQAVPVAGGEWAPVALGTGSSLTRLASDGLHLFAGTREGQVLGLDPANGRTATLATLPSEVTALRMGQGALWAGTARGVFRVPLAGGSAQRLAADAKVQELALGKEVVYSLGDRLYAWQMDGSAVRTVPDTEGATALTSYRGVAYLGTADGWVLRSKDDGLSTQALGQMVDTPLEAVATDGAWLYSASGNSTYMLDLGDFSHAPCHAGFAAEVGNLTVLDAETVLVGTRGAGLTSMPR